MIRINLLPSEYAKKAAARRKTAVITAAVILVICGFAGVYFSRVARLSVLESRIDEIERELNKLRPVVKRVKSVSNKKAELDRKLKVITDLMQTRIYYPVFMESLAAIFTRGTWISALTTTGGSGGELRLSMNLEGRDNYTVAEFLNALENSAQFSGIDFKGISTKVGAEEELRIFRLGCIYNPEAGEEEKKD